MLSRKPRPQEVSSRDYVFLSLVCIEASRTRH
jgi:hypothetical protein